MGLMRNRIEEFALQRGIPNAEQFWKDSGLPRATAFRLFRRQDLVPMPKTLAALCDRYKTQPGDFLEYVHD